MERYIFVFLGGGVGSLLRYQVGRWSTQALGFNWPYGTFIVNVVGGLCMGFLVGFLAHRGGPDQERWRVMLGVGVLGGFTTFSAFTLEVALMLERRIYGQAAGYIAASVLLALAALFIGLLTARRLFA
jgi:CrcB protein